MNILEQLGINGTYFYQLAIFIGVLIVLTSFVFADFAKVLEARDQKTVGNEGQAQGEHIKAAELQHAYEIKAREINGEIKSIYDSYRLEASREYEKIVAAAKAESAKLIEESRSRVSVQVAEVSRRLSDEVPALSQAMVAQLLAAGGGTSHVQK